MLSAIFTIFRVCFYLRVLASYFRCLYFASALPVETKSDTLGLLFQRGKHDCGSENVGNLLGLVQPLVLIFQQCATFDCVF